MTNEPRAQRPAVVLIADAHEWSSRALATALEPHGYAVLTARDGNTALELTRSAHPDALILDSELPEVSGLDVCARLREDAQVPAYLPIIVTSADNSSRQDRIAALNCGAWEFLTQPLDAALLLPLLATLIRAKRAVDRLVADTLVDSVTGLYNMRGMALRAVEITSTAARLRAPVACVAFTTSLSAAEAGEEEPPQDMVSSHVADMCRAAARQSDAVGRIDNQLFAILAPATGTDGANRLADRLRERFASTPLRFGESPYFVQLRARTVAVGNAADSSLGGTELLLRAVDRLGDAGLSAG